MLELYQIFSSAPVIYSILMCLSVSSMTLWLYTLRSLRTKYTCPSSFVEKIQKSLENSEWEEAEDFCRQQSNILASILYAGLAAKKLGPQLMLDAMKSQGKKESIPFWQKLTLLNEITLVAPMFGLLGTVLGMFYAFYDMNRSLESIHALLDGLGVAVGTTVFGLIVAIATMILGSILKYRLVSTMSHIETKALELSRFLSRVSVKTALEKKLHYSIVDKE